MKSIPCIMVVAVATATWLCNATAQTVIPNPQATESGFFGWSIAPAGSMAVVGAVNNIVSGVPAGAAYVLDSTTGSVLRTIVNPQPAAGNHFGSSMAALGGDVLIGDPVHQPPQNAAGSAYLFDISTGALQRTFLDPKPGLATGNYFGQSVALDGSTALVGSPRTDNNSAVYQFDITTGNLLRTYTQPAPALDTEFGKTIAAAHGRLAVGSRGGDPTAAVHLFDTASGAILKSIPNPNPVTGEYFGNSLALTDRWLAVGAPQSITGSGVVYLFNVSTGNLLRTLTDPSPKTGSQFGYSVFALGDYVLVGANQQDRGSADAGAAYLFNGLTGDLLATYLNPNPEASDLFGGAVALSGGKAFFGAHSSTSSARDAGTVFSFPSVAEPGLTGDYNNDGGVDASDYLIWRKHVGYVVPACSRGDANCNGFVEVGDYQPWRSNYGRTIGGGSGASANGAIGGAANVPEPSALWLALFASIGGLNRRMICRQSKCV